MVRLGRGLECPARSTYTGGHKRVETNKALETATTATIFGAAIELPSMEFPTIGSESMDTYAMGYLVLAFATQPVRLLPAVDCVHARVSAHVWRHFA